MARSGAEHGHYSKTPAQRARILDAAMAVFALRGERGTSLREIAERVGMSQAGLLHHFGSKSDLLLAVLDRFEQQEQPAEPLSTLAESIDFVRGELARGLHRPGLFQLQAMLAAEATDPEHPAHTFFADRYQRVTRQFEETLRTAADEGAALPEGVDISALAHLVIAAMDGLQLQRLLNDEVDVLASFDLLVQALTSRHDARDR
ncbi:TetR family transcriptional regulator [Streptomyces sp. NPDC127039]|uniref:TetR family transcriptional regulator n=1 Tax=Streptomyces sp. NPDC127039 TaxID=3347115 RepID=UPI003648586A